MTFKYSWSPSLPDFRDHLYEATILPGSLPPSVDLRSSMPPVYDQGNLGSCTANAAAGAYEYLLKNEKLADFTPSRLFIYYNERVIDKSPKTQDTGSYLRTAAKTLNQDGVADEKKWPYVEAKFKNKPPKTNYTFAAKHKVTKYASIDNTKVTDIQSALAGGFPVIFGFTVYDSFESDEVARTGIVPLPTAREKVLGGHAVCIVGYKQMNGQLYFIVRNSWGTTWGAAGYCYFPATMITNTRICSDFWQIQLVS